MADVAPGKPAVHPLRRHDVDGPLRDRAREPRRADRTADRPPLISAPARPRDRRHPIPRSRSGSPTTARPRCSSSRSRRSARSGARRCSSEAAACVHVPRAVLRVLFGAIGFGLFLLVFFAALVGRALGRNEHRADVRLGALLARARPARRPVRERLGLAEPLARGGGRVAWLWEQVAARVGPAVRLSGAAGPLAGRSAPLRVRRDGARVHRPRRTRACSRSRSRSTAGSRGSGSPRSAEAWLPNGEAFTVYFWLLSRSLATTLRDEDWSLRRPLDRVARDAERPGTVAFVSVMLGSVAFDGFSRTSYWQDRLFRIDSQTPARSPFNLARPRAGVAIVAGAYVAASRSRASIAGRRAPRAGVHRQPDPDRARVRRRALPHAAPDPGASSRSRSRRTPSATAGTSSARSTSASTCSR